ncbi:MAG: NAD-binding protein [Phycisphaerales bacterium]|nr:MAG: NAD-binding protein [Phycisphaerales bacterium]
MTGHSDKPDRIEGIYQNGNVTLRYAGPWADGTKLTLHVEQAEPPTARSTADPPVTGQAVIAGFGPPGRWVGEILDRYAIPYVIIDLNERTVEAQRKLGRRAIAGDVTDERVLKSVCAEGASMLFLTIPDQKATIEATRIARRISPRLFIVARTWHTSAGFAARQAGADEVVRAEQAVARRFCDRLFRKIHGWTER